MTRMWFVLAAWTWTSRRKLEIRSGAIWCHKTVSLAGCRKKSRLNSLNCRCRIERLGLKQKTTTEIANLDKRMHDMSNGEKDILRKQISIIKKFTFHSVNEFQTIFITCVALRVRILMCFCVAYKEMLALLTWRSSRRWFESHFFSCKWD